MGITNFDVELIHKALKINPDIKSVMELGSQNLYTTTKKNPPFASELYKSLGISYDCVDLAGDNEALKKDLSLPIDFDKTFDLVTDFGTSEHVVYMRGYTTMSYHHGYIHSVYPEEVVENMKIDALYYCWLNKHKFLNRGGIMINANPQTGSWPKHGYHYYTTDFYKELCKIAGYEILTLGTHAAMGNKKDGWNVYSILRKISSQFPSLKEFKTLPIHTS